MSLIFHRFSPHISWQYVYLRNKRFVQSLTITICLVISISAICYSLFSFVFLSNIASENFGLRLYTIHLLQANRCEFHFPFPNFSFRYFKGRKMNGKMETFHVVSTLGFMSKLWNLTAWKTVWLTDQPTEWSETKRVSCIRVNNNKQTRSLYLVFSFYRPNWKHLYTISMEENISSFFSALFLKSLKFFVIFFSKMNVFEVDDVWVQRKEGQKKWLCWTLHQRCQIWWIVIILKFLL